MLTNNNDVLICVVKEAGEKFGKVHSIRATSDTSWIVLIEREYPVFEDKPYMNIRAYHHGYVSFEHGSYDLSLDDAIQSFNRRK